MTIETNDKNNATRFSGLTEVQWEAGKLWLETQIINWGYTDEDRTWLDIFDITMDQMVEVEALLSAAAG